MEISIRDNCTLMDYMEEGGINSIKEISFQVNFKKGNSCPSILWLSSRGLKYQNQLFYQAFREKIITIIILIFNIPHKGMAMGTMVIRLVQLISEK